MPTRLRHQAFLSWETCFIVLVTIVATLINFLGINPIAALFWTAVINGVLVPSLLVLLLLIANNPKVMDERVNGRWLNLGGWITT